MERRAGGNCGMGSRSLLIVDDDANVREALARWFTMRGYAVTTAEDGMEAIARCREKAFTIITLDLEMPKLSGLDALAPLRELQPGVPIVVLTGYGRDAEAALSRGAAKVLMKPMRLTGLEAELDELLAGRDSDPPAN